MTPKFLLQKLEAIDKVDDFDCGHKLLNDYLIKYALLNQKTGVSKTYVALHGERVIGFYSLATASICPDVTPKKVSRGLPKYDIPAMLLARLAVDQPYQGKGIGEGLLRDAVLRTIEVSKIVGVRTLLVHAKDAKAAQWYKKYDFEESPVLSRHLFLTIKDAIKALER